MKWFAYCLFACLIGHPNLAMASSRLVSLNPCFDDWAPTWLPADWHFIPSTKHGNRLERILSLEPDFILYGTYTNARLIHELAQQSEMVLVQEPNSWQQWRQSVTHMASNLQLENEVAAWLAEQELHLEHLPKFVGPVMILMPNQYIWGGQSFSVDLLRRLGLEVMVLNEQVTLQQLTLEQVIQMDPHYLVLDGFSSTYARANEWLWHNALRPWLAARRVAQIPIEVSGCPAQRAVDYARAVTIHAE